MWRQLSLLSYDRLKRIKFGFNSFLILSIFFSLFQPNHSFAAPPEKLQRWLSEPQNWKRDVEGPIVSLGSSGSFDDTHLFAPMVSREQNRFQLWYCGSQGDVARRVFRMGRATSRDGRLFQPYEQNPVFDYGDGKHSVLTPTILRTGTGETVREGGELRIWFSSTWFAGKSGKHTLHETTSPDGIHWSPPSEPLLEDVYAPSIIKEGNQYKMWYTDVGSEPWQIRHAVSDDGRSWQVMEKPCVVIDQKWEQNRLFYPTVLKLDHVYLMWYGSYWGDRKNSTALGFAASLDGKTWYKHSGNPVFKPDPNRHWESHYVTSQSIMRLEDGSLRIWYASRKKPPFINKYFAINTAVWKLSE